MAKSVIKAREKSAKAIVIACAGNVHSQVTKGAVWDPKYIPMGWYVSKKVKNLVSLNAKDAGGQAWGITERGTGPTNTVRSHPVRHIRAKDKLIGQHDSLLAFLPVGGVNDANDPAHRPGAGGAQNATEMLPPGFGAAGLFGTLLKPSTQPYRCLHASPAPDLRLNVGTCARFLLGGQPWSNHRRTVDKAWPRRNPVWAAGRDGGVP
jgi:hypothetical protein